MNKEFLRWLGSAVLIAVALFIAVSLTSCSVRFKHPSKAGVTYTVVEKKKTAKVYHNADGVYYTQNDLGLWMVWMNQTSVGSTMGGHTYVSVPYSSVDRFTTTPSFSSSSGVFVPVSGQPGLAGATSSGKSFDVREESPVGSGGFGNKAFDPGRDQETEQEAEADFEAIDTPTGEISSEALAEDIATESASDSTSDFSTSSSESSSGDTSSGGDFGGGGDSGGGGGDGGGGGGGD